MHMHAHVGQSRRRSVDNGGLALSSVTGASGYGWGGWEEWEMQELEPRFAQVLSDLYQQTLDAVQPELPEQPWTDVSSETRTCLINALGNWNFEPHKLSDEHILACTYIIFESLFRIEGMQEEIGVSIRSLACFLRHLRQIYRWENPYHNFAHALDVLQAAHKFLAAAGMVPPVSILLDDSERMWKSEREYDNPDDLITCLRKHDLFIVYVAAIGHDVGHPGHSNAMIKNAQAPLSIVYDGRSPLEQMHCFLLLKVMRHHGLGAFLDRPDHGPHIRRLLWETIIATDMSVHADFMNRFTTLLTPEQVPVHIRQVLTCQAIIKCADISNPSRPHCVAEYWASALSQEWSSQCLLEKYFELPSTVKPSDGPLSVARGQIWFIENFTLPLLSLTSRAVPEINDFVLQCVANLQEWKSRSAALSETETQPASPASSSYTSTPFRHPDDMSTVFPFTLPPARAHHSAWNTGSSYSPFSPSSVASWSSEKRSTDEASANASFSPSSVPTSPSTDSSAVSPKLSPQLVDPTTTAWGYDGPSKDAVLKATFHAGLRKRKEAHRSSWNPSSSSREFSTTTPTNHMRWAMPNLPRGHMNVDA